MIGMGYGAAISSAISVQRQFSISIDRVRVFKDVPCLWHASRKLKSARHGWKNWCFYVWNIYNDVYIVLIIYTNA